MRSFAVLLSFGFVLCTTLGCSEHELASIEPPPEADVDPNVAPTVPPPPAEPEGPLAPIADAGPGRLWATNTPIELDGSGSYDPNGSGLQAYTWTVVDGPLAITLSDAGRANPSFATGVPGTYTFELTVQNEAGLWDDTPASVAIVVEENPVLEPVANAGPDQTLRAGTVVDLDGSASFDPQGLAPLAYAWQIVTRPPGSTAVLDDNGAARPSFLADRDGTYIVELQVMNAADVIDSTPDPVRVVATPVVLPPVADAGMNINASTGSLVTLNGANSFDPAGLAPLTYSWAFTQRPTGSTAVLALAGTAHPTFTPDVPGAYSVTLNVGNTAGLWDLTPDTVDLTISQTVVVEPVADAGPDVGVLPLQTVQLDGRASYDPSGLAPLTYQWTLVGQPAGSSATLSNREVVEPSFFVDLAGVYTFELTVMNSDGTWDTTPDTVVVEAVPLDGFYVEVSWDNVNDLDLHILDGASALWSDGDVNYCNLAPSWGAPGTDDDPSLDADAVYGFGPETTTIEVPAAGTYHVNVHYYGLDGGRGCGSFSSCPATVASVKIYLGGVLTQEFTRTLDTSNQLWDVASIQWPSGTITAVDTVGVITPGSCF